MRQITLGGVGLEEDAGHPLIAVVLLSSAPDPAWIACFRARARDAAFGSAAAFRRNQVRIVISRREDLAALIQSVERWITGANIDAATSHRP